MEYDAYPMTGRYFRVKEPAAQSVDKKKAIQKTLLQLPLLQEMADRLQERIDFYASIDAIAIDMTKDVDMHRNLMFANRIVRDELNKERVFLMAEVEKASKR